MGTTTALRGHRAREWAALAVTLCLSSADARAQQAPDPSTTRAEDVAEPGSETATLRVLVFVGESPVEGATVRVGDHSATTERGVAELEVAPGMQDVEVEFVAVFEDGNEVPTKTRFSVGMIAGQSSEAIGHLPAAGEEVAWEVEGASAEQVEAAQKVEEAKAFGTIRGQATSVEDSAPVANARVFARGLDVDATTDADGRFSLEVPVGTHAISLIHPEFSTMTRPDIEVTENAVTDIEVALTPASVRMDDFVVTAPHIEGGLASLISERRESTAVADVVGAEQMSKSGASDAASALSRVTGLTVVDGKYVFVRGMGLRYSSTLLNGFSVPSPEPTLRVVPLDMFPSDVIESLVVEKSFSPERPAEFGGGVVMIRTRTYPEEWEAKLSIGTGGNTNTTFRNRVSYQGSSTDWLGIDNGQRQMSPELRQASSEGKIQEGNMFRDGFSSEELESLGESLQNVWNIRRQRIPMDGSLTASLGNSFELGRATWGFMTSVFYNNQYEYTEGNTRTVKVADDAGNVGIKDSYQFENTQQTVGLGGVFNTGVEIKGQKIESNTLVLRITDDQTLLQAGTQEDNGPLQQGRMRFQERQLFTQQFLGHHSLEGNAEEPEDGEFAFDWRYAYSKASNDEPDRRDFSYSLVDRDDLSSDYFHCQRPFCNGRFFGEVRENMHDAAVDFTAPFPLWQDLQGKAQVGAAISRRERSNYVRRYKWQWEQGNRSANTSITTQDLEGVFDPQNTGPDGFSFLESTQDSENYTAEHGIEAGYLKTELEVAGPLVWMVGARVEHSLQRAVVVDPFDANAEPVVSTVESTDVLPASTLTWRVTEEHQLRFGYGRTVNRPLLREMVEAPFVVPERGWTYRGNPNVTRAILDNFDLRWEWYLSGDETISVGLFAKRFTDPIEAIQEAGAQITVRPQNADSARNLGAEIEARKRLDFVTESLEDLYVAGNVALIWSQIEFEDPGIQTDASRALQGQAPYMVNAQMGYDTLGSHDFGLSAALLYNVVGPSIFVVGQQGIPNGYAQPVHNLDFVYIQDLGDHLKLKFKAENLLNYVVRATQGDIEVLRYREGLSFSLSLSGSL